MRNNKTKIVLTLSFIALLLFSSFVLAQDSPSASGSSGGGGGGAIVPAPTPSSGGGGGGGSTNCHENWVCSDWSSCISGSQYRECIDLNKCGTSVYKPIITASCTTDYYYRNAYFQCYDGSTSYQGSDSSCKSSETWSKYGQEFCLNKCTSSTSTSAALKCGINTFQVYNVCTTSSTGSGCGSSGGYGSSGTGGGSTNEPVINESIPTISKEQVKCVFENSNNAEKCYSDNGKFACSGTGSCTSSVSGESGTKLTWKSSCSGYAYTTIDGYNEIATFKCVEQMPTGQPDLVINNLQVYQKSDPQYGTATWVEYDLANIGKADINQGFLNTIYVDSNPIGRIWYWKGLPDDKTADTTSQYPNVPALKAGESVHRAHRFFVYYEGTHKVSVKADSYVNTGDGILDESYNNLIKESNEDNNKATVAFNFGTSTTPPEPTSYVEVVISPEKQYTKDGFATYDVIIYDHHTYTAIQYACIPTAGQPCPIVETPRYNYNLYFYSEQNINGEFENSVVTVPANSKVAVKLKVQTKYKGTNIFEVTAKGTESKDSSKGILTYGLEPPTEPASYFNGQGFALSAEKKAGALVDLHLLKNGESIQGKFNLENTNYKVKGTQSNNLVKLEIYSVEGKEEIATFLGTMSEFDTFLLLQGNVYPIKSDKIGSWHITAFSKKEKSFVVVEAEPMINEPTTKNIQVGEIISVPTEKISEQTGESKNIYIQSKEVIKERFFGIFPTGRNLLEIEAIDENGKVTKITLKPFGTAVIGNHKIQAGSSFEDKSIEITINKISDTSTKP